jgi:hypothetical protein
MEIPAFVMKMEISHTCGRGEEKIFNKYFVAQYFKESDDPRNIYTSNEIYIKMELIMFKLMQ